MLVTSVRDEAGTEESTIPDRCTLIIERRTLPGETIDKVRAEVTAVLDGLWQLSGRRGSCCPQRAQRLPF
ncbi:MAG: Peptidase dimerization domain, partial [Actinomycetota bacterium]|nr:Peptidase dimerization domain [Actinomycetota bacterium]